MPCSSSREPHSASAFLMAIARWLLAISIVALFALPRLTRAADDLTPLGDEFSDPATLANWSRIYEVEGWGANQLESLDINTSRAGWITFRPYTSTWYQDWRGELTFKTVTGDFVATTRVQTSNRAMNAAPSRTYSLGGIMVRAPRAITNPSTQWVAGGENYVFLSHGTGDTPGTYQFEVKTTQNSDSVLQLSTAGVSEALIQVARIGNAFLMLRRTGAGPWVVHRRYSRTDMPSTLQVGMTVYTDWPNASQLQPFAHNSTVITNGQPDLLAWFEYFRFARPVVPAELTGLDLTNPAQVSDAQLLAFLGDTPNLPVSTATPTLTPTVSPTVSPTASTTPSPSPSLTPTPTASLTPSPTESLTPSPTASQAPTLTPTAAPTLSPSPAPTSFPSSFMAY